MHVTAFEMAFWEDDTSSRTPSSHCKMKWYRFRTVKSKLGAPTPPRYMYITCRKRRRELLRQTSHLEPEVETERRRRVGSVSTSTEDAVAVERMVRKAVLTPQRDQDGRVRRHGRSTGRGPRFFHTVTGPTADSRRSDTPTAHGARDRVDCKIRCIAQRR